MRADSAVAGTGRELSSALAAVGVRDDAATVDLRHVTWFDPLLLVAVASMAHGAYRRGRRFRLRGPADPDRASYAARMRLGHTLDRLGADHDLPRVSERDRRGELLEVSMLAGPADVRDLAALVHDKVRDADRIAAAALYQSLCEIGGNVPEHSGTQGFMAAQTLRHAGQVRFAVADSGVGLLGTLRGRGAVDDEHALTLALSGVSSLPGPERGQGLSSTLHLVSELGGSVALASGQAAVVASGPGRHRLSAPAFTGTLFGAHVAVWAG